MTKYKGDFLKEEDTEAWLSKYNKKAQRLCLCVKYNPGPHYFESDGSFNRICPKCKVSSNAELSFGRKLCGVFNRIPHRVRLQEKV